MNLDKKYLREYKFKARLRNKVFYEFECEKCKRNVKEINKLEPVKKYRYLDFMLLCDGCFEDEF
jgi:hypothetical protein